MKITAILIIILSGVTVCHAGEIKLDNGDVLQGELKAIHAEHIEWSSELFGNLKIPKNRVVELQSSMPMKLTARKGACYWGGMERRRVILECDRYGEIEQTLVSLKDAVRYDNGNGRLKEKRGKISATGSRESGNVSKQDWAVDSNVFFRHDEYRHDTWVKYWAEQRDEQDLQQRMEASYQFDWFFAPKTFWSTKVSALKDDPRRITQRYALGTGLGYQFWESRRSALSLQSGPEYIDSVTFDQNDPDLTTQEAYSSWRLASNFRFLFPRDIVFFNKTEYLQSMEESGDYEVEANSGVSLPIAGGVTADISHFYRYDNSPAEGQEGSDSRLRVGVGYQW